MHVLITARHLNLKPQTKAYAEQKGLSSNNAAVRVFRAREALKKRVIESCGTCAEHGCVNCTCKRA